MSTLDDVIETVRSARADGPDALAAMALSYGATMALGVVRNRALRGQIVELRAAQTAADEMVATLRHERDAAREALAPDLDYPARAEVWRLRESVEALRVRAERAEAERDESMAADDLTRAQWATVRRERDEAREALATAGKIAAQAVREREAFSLRLSAAERERDEARQERDAALARPTYEARTVAPTRPELERHKATHGRWLVTWQDSPVPSLCSEVVAGVWPTRTYPVGAVYVALGADGLPCAWPVVP